MREAGNGARESVVEDPEIGPFLMRSVILRERGIV